MNDNQLVRLEIEYVIQQGIDDYLDEKLFTRIAELFTNANLQGSRIGNAQFSSLLNLVRETSSVEVVLNWIRYQMGRYSVWRDENFGTLLLSDLTQLKTQAEAIINAISPEKIAQYYSHPTSNPKQVLIRHTWRRLIEQYVGQLSRYYIGQKGKA